MFENPKDLIAWLDVETTGLDPESHQLLEVALIVTDWDLNILNTGYTATVKYTMSTVAGLRSLSDEYVNEMHERTGLWDRLADPSARPLAAIQKDIYEYLKYYAPAQGQARLGGNSVALDAAFSAKYLPKFKEHLHYRVLDMSSLQEAATKWLGIPTFEKKLEHSALADITESIEQARFIRNKLRSGFNFPKETFRS